VSGTPEGFGDSVRKNGDLVVTHHGTEAAVRRSKAAARFLVDVERRDPQQVMARVTGHYRHGNERQAAGHERNRGDRGR
jgi:hypothetical protein